MSPSSTLLRPLSVQEIQETLEETFGPSRKFEIPEIDKENRYTVYTFYCHGGILESQCQNAATCVRLYTRRLIAGVKGQNQQSNPLWQPYHVKLMGVVMRDEDGTINHQLFSDYFPCAHDGELFPSEYHLERLLES